VSDPTDPAPRIFISYAGEDWSRFVEGFAARLRGNGVNAWVAPWEIKAGDSLVNKIFVEGLGPADTIIVVLSQNSFHKPWVEAELDVAVVKRIEDKTNLIPLRLDHCVIPIALRATKYISVPNIASYDAEFTQIIESVFGVSNRPPLGPPPAWVAPRHHQFSGLNKLDSQVLEVFCIAAMNKGYLNLDVKPLLPEFSSHDISRDLLNSSIRRMKDYHYMSAQRVATGDFSNIQISLNAFTDYAKSVFPQFDEVVHWVVAQAASTSPNQIRTLTAPEGVPQAVFRTVVELLSGRGLLNVKWNGAGGAWISGVSARIEEYLP